VLALIRDLLRLEVARMRAAGIPVGEDEFRGLYTSDEEADRLLRDGAAGVQPGADFRAVRAALSSFVESDDGRVGELARIAGLDPFEANCVLLCLASEADLGIERLIGYVQDDVTKRRPRIDLALRLLAEDVTSAGAAFEATSALRRLRLISLHDEPGQPHTPLRAKYIALPAGSGLPDGA
jgi:hypothetical protein